MQKRSENIDDKLLRYIDGELNEADRAEIVTLLKSDSELQERLNWLRKVDNYLHDSSLESPSTNFTNAVMDGLGRYQARGGISPLKGLLLLTGVIITIGLAVLLVYSGAFDGTATINVNTPAYDTFFKRSLPTIPVNGKLVVDTIIVLNLIIAFVVLDRTILKPWFQRRTKMYF